MFMNCILIGVAKVFRMRSNGCRILRSNGAIESLENTSVLLEIALLALKESYENEQTHGYDY